MSDIQQSKNNTSKALILFSIIILVGLVPFISSGISLILSTIILSIHLYSSGVVSKNLVRFIKPLVFIIFIGSLSGLKAIFMGDYYFYFRDVYYFLQPLIILLIGYYSLSRGVRYEKILRLIIIISIISTLYTYKDFLLNFNFSSIASLSKRYNYALSSEMALIGFILVYYSKVTGTKIFNEIYENLLIVFFFSVIFISLSRTNIAALALIVLLPLFNKIISFKKIFWIIIPIFLIPTFLGSFIPVGVPDEQAITFTEKVANSYSEIIVRDYDTMRNINLYWRSKEAYLGLSKYMEGSFLEIIFGQGFGAYVDGRNIFEEKLQVIPIFHNGYITIILKTGVVGFFFFILFLFNMMKISFKPVSQNQRVANQYSLLMQGLVITIIVQTNFVMGIYTPNTPFTLLLLAGMSFRGIIFIKSHNTS